jgi:2'-5' RNA ligase
MKTLERINNVRDSRTFYHSLQESEGEFKPRVTICRKNNGDMAASKDEVVTQWMEYFEETLIGEVAEDYPKGTNRSVESGGVLSHLNRC